MMKKIALCLALSVGLSSVDVRAESGWGKWLWGGAAALLATGVLAYFNYFKPFEKNRLMNHVVAGAQSQFETSSLKKDLIKGLSPFDITSYRSSNFNVYVSLSKKIKMPHLKENLSKGPITQVILEAKNFKTKFVGDGKNFTTLTGDFMIITPFFKNVDGLPSDAQGMVTVDSFKALQQFAKGKQKNIKKIVVGLYVSQDNAERVLSETYSTLTLYFTGENKQFKQDFPNADEIYLLSTGAAIDYYNQLESQYPGSVAGLFYFTPLK